METTESVLFSILPKLATDYTTLLLDDYVFEFHDLALVVSCFPSLQSLCVHSVSDPVILSETFTLPDSVRLFHLNAIDIYEDSQSLKSLHPFVDRMPRFSKLRVTYCGYRPRMISEPQSTSIMRTALISSIANACVKRNIQFEGGRLLVKPSIFCNF